MTTPIEDRLRAHFANRAEREPLVPPAPLEGLEVPSPRPSRHRSALLVAAALLLVAGTVAGVVVAASDDGRPRVVTTPDGETTTVAPSTTTAPAATSAPTTTVSTTTLLTTTTAAPDAREVRSVILSSLGVMGWWDGTRWVPEGEGVVPARRGDHYKVVGMDRPATDAIGSDPILACDYDAEFTVQDIALDPPIVGEGTRVHVAVSGVADPTPRAVTRLSNDTPVYVEATSQVLAGLGLEVTEPRLTDVLQVDLDGDGVEEVVVAGERHEPTETGYGELGDHEVVFLRRLVDGVAEHTVLVHDIVTESDLAYPDSSDFYTTLTRLVAIADLNGDGRMEVVVTTSGWELSRVDAFELGRTDAVLSIGCAL